MGRPAQEAREIRAERQRLARGLRGLREGPRGAEGRARRLLEGHEAEFDAWTKPQQQAFLINAYNAFTVELILTRYPDLKSIRDFGSVFGNPWKDKFFTLFGQPSYLDFIEHETLRKEGVYDDPRVHVAVVCASIGCPMLRNEAFTADNLEAQLDDAMRRFLSDRTRNRYNPQSKKLEISKIFDWYGKDFEKGHKGFSSVKATLARYADQLADKPEDRAVVSEREGRRRLPRLRLVAERH